MERIKYGFILPALILLIAMNVFPLFYSVFLSFTDAELSGGGAQFIGISNYTRIFSEPRYAAAIRTTGLFVLIAVSVELIAGYLLALALRDAFPGKGVLLTLLLIPMMLSPAVMGLYWNLILNGHYGVLNQMLSLLMTAPPQWLTDPDLKLISVLMVDIWMWTPFMTLIALAGLQAIPGYLYEAAEIDRASRWSVFRRITLPLSAPILMLAVLFRVTDALKQFDVVMAITGPNDVTTQTLSALLYQIMLRDYRLGLGAAFALVVLAPIIALATVFIRYLHYITRRQGRAEA